MLAELINNPKATASAGAMAAERILDRGYGRPPQLDTADAGQYDELARIASGDDAATRRPSSCPIPRR